MACASELPTWTCADCRVEMIGGAPADGRCHRCRLRRLESWSPGRPLDAATVDRVPLEQRPSCPRAQVLRACGVPAEYLEPFEKRKLPGGAWPRDARTDRRVDLAEWTFEPPLHTLLLKGDVGQGKTMAAVEIGYRLWLRGRSFGYVMAAELVAALFGQQAEKLHRLRRIQALLVDDIDRGPSGAAWHPVFGFLHRHIATHRPLLVTQNSPLAKGDGALFEANAALADRLKRGLVVTFTGGSQR